jgi:transcriptional regulator with XRE-family HTH domain
MKARRLRMSDKEQRKENFDFTQFSKEIKAARNAKGWSREYVAELIDRSVDHLAALENKGTTPGIQLFFRLVKLFNISVDNLFFENNTESMTTERRQIEALLDTLGSDDLYIVKTILIGISEVHQKGVV